MEELRFGSDDLDAVVLPAIGGRLHRLRAHGHDLLRTPSDARTHATDPWFWGGYVMAPWCNRILPGPVTAAGRTVDLRPNFPDGTAIHGQLAARPWEIHADGSLSVHGGGDGWPWPYEVVARVDVDGPSLALDYRLINRADGPMPAGLGLHPWFRRPVELRVDASEAYRSNSASPATPGPVRDELDLRSLGMPAADLDGTWVAPSSPAATLAWPDAGLRATLEVAAPRVCVAVATPAALDAIAVEPQTHGPDGLRRLIEGERDALVLLEPGESLRLAVRITVERVSLSR